MCVLKISDGPLVQTLSPSSPITLLQMFIFGSKGLLAITISPLEECNRWGQKCMNVWSKYHFKINTKVSISYFSHSLLYSTEVTAYSFWENHIVVNDGGFHGRSWTLLYSRWVVGSFKNLYVFLCLFHQMIWLNISKKLTDTNSPIYSKAQWAMQPYWTV